VEIIGPLAERQYRYGEIARKSARYTGVWRVASSFAGTGSFYSVMDQFKYWLLPVIIGLIFAGVVQMGWLPGRPDGQIGLASKHMARSGRVG
jgi:hypothetical protein